MKASRQQVYSALDGERDYQDLRWNFDTTPTGGVHTVSEFILYMEEYLQKARTVVSAAADPEASENGLHMIRKVTALGVACMEQNGAPRRQ